MMASGIGPVNLDLRGLPGSTIINAWVDRMRADGEMPAGAPLKAAVARTVPFVRGQVAMFEQV